MSEHRRVKTRIRRVQYHETKIPCDRRLRTWPWLAITHLDEDGNDHGMAFSTKTKAFKFAALPYAAQDLEVEHSRARASRTRLTR